MALKLWMVITPMYPYTEVVTDEGQGPTYDVADVIEIEAETAKDAIALGVKIMLENKWRPDKYTKYEWCRDQRSDGLCPYTGVKAFLYEDDDEY